MPLLELLPLLLPLLLVSRSCMAFCRIHAHDSAESLALASLQVPNARTCTWRPARFMHWLAQAFAALTKFVWTSGLPTYILQNRSAFRQSLALPHMGGAE